MRGVAIVAVLIFVAGCNTSVGLQSRTWVWETTLYNDDAVHTPNEAGAFTLTFTDEGQVT